MVKFRIESSEWVQKGNAEVRQKRRLKVMCKKGGVRCASYEPQTYLFSSRT